MHPIPGQSLPEGWVYIEHPEAGQSAHPVPRSSLGAWAKTGWTEVVADEPTAATTSPKAPRSATQAKEA